MSRNQNHRVSKPARRLQLLTLVLAAWTGDGVAETYMILSLVGDRLTIVSQERQTGSHLDQNRHEVVPVTESRLDDFAVRVADATIGKVRPDASVITLRVNDPTLYALRASWLDGDVIEIRELLSLIAK
jgi:hypothetical protein